MAAVVRAWWGIMAGQRAGEVCVRSDGAAAAGGNVALCYALECREWKKREWEERDEGVNESDSEIVKIFNWNVKKFEYESCSKFKSLQLSFQAQTHLNPTLKVNFKLLQI